MCDTDTKACDVCSVEGAKFNEGQSKCIIGDDNSDGGGLCVGAIIGEFSYILVAVIRLIEPQWFTSGNPQVEFQLCVGPLPYIAALLLSTISTFDSVKISRI